MLEAILRQATEDSEFEFKTKSTAYPIQENIKKDQFTQERLFSLKSQNNYLMMIKSWTDVGLRLNAIFCFTYIILSSSIVSQLVSERTSHAKLFQIQNGLTRVHYWFVRYIWDIIKFLPVSWVIHKYAADREPQMIVF